MILDQFTTEGLFDYASCSHYRAVRYFIESISDPTAFQSYKSKNYSTFKKGKCNKCTSKTCLNMGYHARKGKTGRYFLQTNSKAPFSGDIIFYLFMFHGICNLHKFILKIS